jgi:hypothetical protein
MLTLRHAAQNFTSTLPVWIEAVLAKVTRQADAVRALPPLIHRVIAMLASAFIAATIGAFVIVLLLAAVWIGNRNRD